MKVKAYHSRLVKNRDRIEDVIASTLPYLAERSVVVIASKIVSTCEGRFVPKLTGEKREKYELVKKEAEFWLPATLSKYELMLTVKRNWMFVNAGIDESNADNQYILWPKDPQASADKIWQFLRTHYKVNEVGVIISDSASRPFNWGVVGQGIAHCGFQPLYSYIGKPDLFGREMKMEQVNIVQSLTTAAVYEMGEGDESQPLAVVEDLPKVEFMDRPHTQEELDALHISIEEDAYAPILEKAPWQKGEGGI